ncbi:hypothetical protein N4G70_18485 [Streptomyces sp. ASQP_92]|uniref:hypothetical protein n=1 Tax=Streptomyces sp. ASQP_92 TaxID=2979116 RepID=UPI0021C107FC|nr:hypothetical protein [Streptomyces sp. ASQP_92]MCT9090829.1 hypothetical protein [Streptomyces sp. ASQP_92]
MGVFSMFRRKAEQAVAESSEGAKAETPTAEPEAGGEGGTAAEAPAAAAQEASEGVTESGATAQGAEPSAAEGVDIPKQQSAEAAADSEAGEGARK